MNIASREVLAALRTESPINVPITSTGYVGVARDKGKTSSWFASFPLKASRGIGQGGIHLHAPREFPEPEGPGHRELRPQVAGCFLDAWTTDGKKLWNGHREGHLVWPTFAYSRTGDRFAVSLLHVSHFIDLADSLNDEDVREQVVQVFDSATGALLMTTNASPILTAGQNFALSEDGERLAVLREGAIEIYKVPRPRAAGKDRSRGRRRSESSSFLGGPCGSGPSPAHASGFVAGGGIFVEHTLLHTLVERGDGLAILLGNAEESPLVMASRRARSDLRT
jgi:hypothetical protein